MFTASMRFDLGEDIAALRDMVQRWAQERVKPLAAEVEGIRVTTDNNHLHLCGWSPLGAAIPVGWPWSTMCQLL